MEQKIEQLVAEIQRVDKTWQEYYDTLEANDFSETDEDETNRIVAESYSDGLKTAYLIMTGTTYTEES